MPILPEIRSAAPIVPDNLRTNIVTAEFSWEETTRLLERCRANDTTVHGVICAAASRHIPASGRDTVRMICPIDLRKIAGVENGICGVFIGASSVQLMISITASGDRDWVMSLYNHINTNQELLFELVKGHMDELLRQVDVALDGVKGPLEQLRTFVVFHVTYHMTKKREVFVGNFELRGLEPKNYDAIVALRKKYEMRLTAILDEGVAQGRFEVSDTQVATFAILAQLTGVCTWYRPGGRLSKEAIVSIHEKLVLDGLVPKKASDPVPAPRG